MLGASGLKSAPGKKGAKGYPEHQDPVLELYRPAGRSSYRATIATTEARENPEWKQNRSYEAQRSHVPTYEFWRLHRECGIGTVHIPPHALPEKARAKCDSHTHQPSNIAKAARHNERQSRQNARSGNQGVDERFNGGGGAPNQIL